MRPARALIDLQALRHNYRLARDLGGGRALAVVKADAYGCLLYTSDAADALLCVDLGGRRSIKKKKIKKTKTTHTISNTHTCGQNGEMRSSR